jgi:hypothetical protein
MAWNDVADDNGTMSTCRGDQRLVFRFGPKGRVDLDADAVKTAVHRGREGEPAHATCPLHRTRVHAWMPIVSNARHKRSSARVRNTDVPGGHGG